MHLSTGASLRDQSNDNKSYFLAPATRRSYLGTTSRPKQRQQIVHLSRATAATRTSWPWGTNSRPKQRQQVVHLRTGAFRDQSNGNKSHILALGHRILHCIASGPKQQRIVHLSIGTPLQDRSSGNKSYFLALGHHFETKPTAKNSTS